MMDLKTKYRMYIIAAAVTAAAVTASVTMQWGSRPASEATGTSAEAVVPDSVRYIQSNFTRALKVEGTRIKDLVLDSDSGKVSLWGAVEKPTLVFRYFDTNCDDCIRKEGELIRQCVTGKDDRILTLGTFQNFNSMRAYNVAKGILWKRLQADPDQQLDWEPDTHEAPYYFILYPDGRASHFFMAVPEFASYTRTYLEGINRLLAD